MVWMRIALALLLGLAVDAGMGAPQDESIKSLKTESFERDPGWEGHNNRLLPEVIPTITQDFGYSETSFAGKDKGEIGGTVFRCMAPSYYAARIADRTLEDKLTASGTFAITASQGSAGVFFGWFNARQPPGTGRPVGSLGLYLDFESSGGRLAVLLLTAGNQTCGTFITRYERYRDEEEKKEMRPTPIRNDGTRYHWKLDYDPAGNEGRGQVHFTITSNSSTPGDFEGKSFTVDLPEGFKDQGTVFDRFGMHNMTKPGNSATIYFGDIEHDGVTESEDRSHWEGSGNRAEVPNSPVGAHDFGFSPKTSFAGGKVGELGGDLWRSGDYGFYADRIGPLTLEDRLEASGKVVLKVGAPDSDVFLGWFSSADREQPPAESGHFLGIHIGGPTRVGHYFLPRFASSRGTTAKVDAGPVLTPDTVLDWSLVYDPAANGGRGELRVTLGSESVTLDLKEGLKAEGAQFDRFGLFNSTAGGQLVRIYLDDLKYTAARAGS